MSEGLKFEALKSDNYYAWSVNMYSALVLKDVHLAVDGGTVYDGLDAPAKTLMNKKALALMRIKISSGLQTLIHTDTSAKVAWERLKSTFKAQSEGRKGMLRTQLKELKKRKDEDVLTYVSRAERLRTELKDACDEELPEQAFIDYLLDGLGPSFNVFVRQVRYANETLSLEPLKPRLFAVEQDIRKDGAQIDDAARAYVSSSRAPQRSRKSAPQKSRGSDKRKGTCHECGEFGHWKRDCPLLKNSGNKERDTRRNTASAFVVSPASVGVSSVSSVPCCSPFSKHPDVDNMVFKPTIAIRPRMFVPPVDPNSSADAGEQIQAGQQLAGIPHVPAVPEQDIPPPEDDPNVEYNFMSLLYGSGPMSEDLSIKDEPSVDDSIPAPPNSPSDTMLEVQAMNSFLEQQLALVRERLAESEAEVERWKNAARRFEQTNNAGHLLRARLPASPSASDIINEVAREDATVPEVFLNEEEHNTEVAESAGENLHESDSVDTVSTMDVDSVHKSECTSFIPTEISSAAADGCAFTAIKAGCVMPRDDCTPNHPASTSAGCNVSSHGALQQASIIFDSGATNHVVGATSFLHGLCEQPTTQRVRGLGGDLQVRGVGELHIQDASCRKLVLAHVLFVPGAAVTLISVACLSDIGLEVVFLQTSIEVYKGRSLLFSAPLRGIYATVRVRIPESLTVVPKANVLAGPSMISYDILHQRLGHPSAPVLKQLVSSGCAHGVHVDHRTTLASPCVACLKAKQTTVAHKTSHTNATRPLELIHVDLMGPLPKSLGGSQYIFVALDDFSRLSFVECLGSKADAGPALLALIALWERALTRKLVAVRSDQGSEFCNKFVDSLLRNKGIVHQTTVRYSPQQNGRAERVNRDIMEKARALLFQSHAPRKLWAEAVVTACRLRNVIPNLGRAKTPFELFYGQKPDLSRLRVFGCTAYVQVPKQKRHKLDPRSEKGVMVGYAKNAKAWRIAMANSRGHMGVVERDSVVFDESSLGFLPDPVAPHLDDADEFDLDDLGEIGAPLVVAAPENIQAPEAEVADPGEPAGGVAPPEEAAMNEDPPEAPFDGISEDSGPMQLFEPGDELPVPVDAAENVPAAAENAPAVAAEQLPAAAAEQLPIAADENLPEIPDDVPEAPAQQMPQELVQNVPAEGAEIAPAPANHRYSRRERKAPVFFKPSFDSLGYTAQLTDEPTSIEEVRRRPDCAAWQQAMHDELKSLQEKGTYSLTTLPPGHKPIPCKWVFKIKRDASGEIIKFKARVVAKGFRQIAGRDYGEVFAPVSKHATLRMLLSIVAQHDLELHQIDVKTAFLNGDLHEVIYMQPPPGFDSGGKVWHLQKALYGLKQAARAWNDKLTSTLRTLGFAPAKGDSSLFVSTNQNRSVFLLCYVDDILLAGTLHSVTQVKAAMSKSFKCHDMGQADLFLGMKIVRHRGSHRLWVGQPHYTREILDRFGMLDARPRRTPLDANLSLSKDSGTPSPDILGTYQELVGCLLYLSGCTRPDIAQAVGVLSRFMSSPTVEHMNAAKQVLRYLIGTYQLGLVFSGGDNLLRGYCDADYAGDVDKRKSTSGFVFLMNGAAISWASKLQPTVAMSTCEAEFVSAANAAKEALWLKTLLGDFTGRIKPVNIFVDNQGALKLIHHPHAHQRTKHIDIAYRFIQDRVERGGDHM